jgi:cell division protein FtsZ
MLIDSFVGGGVGGGGINAANQMFFHIKDINFAVLDSDSQQLNESPIPDRVLLESIPGHDARYVTEENEAEIATLFDDDTKWAIIVAGMGGETGTNVAPVVTRIAREKEVALTIGIVTIPFRFEGPQKILKALKGVEEMIKHVDALFIFNNQHLTEIFNDLDQTNAFAKSDETLTTAVRSLYCLITPIDPRVCMDFNDVNFTLRKGGNAFIVSGFGSGERRVTKALENALESPLLKSCDVFSFKKILMIIYSNHDSETPLLMKEVSEIQEFNESFDHEVDVIWASAHDSTLKDQIKVTILATGFDVSYKSDIKPLKNMLSQNG